MIVYYLFHIVAALGRGDEKIGGLIKNWLTENLDQLTARHLSLAEKFLPETESGHENNEAHHSQESFNRYIEKIQKNLAELLDPNGNHEPTGTKLNSYLDFILLVKF
jgi:hypothetical protein